jgi:glycosyltransferase involved in cell wall biosynthesis
MSQPLVSIGIPVKDGESGVARALHNVLSQPYRHIEVIVSDNCSTDGTAGICSSIAAADSRVRFFRQPEPISATDNFNYVMRQATGPYFMWAAHDDLRSENFVEALVARLEADRRAILAFGNMVLSYPNGATTEYPFNFETSGQSRSGRLWKASQIQCYHIYGVWRRDALLRVKFHKSLFWPDLAVMAGASCLGEFVRVPEAVFFRAEQIKSNEEIVRYGFYVSARQLGRVRLMWGLWTAMYETVRDVSNRATGLLAVVFTTIKFIRQTARFRERRQRRLLG